jgi:hypothetical protein
MFFRTCNLYNVQNVRIPCRCYQVCWLSQLCSEEPKVKQGMQLIVGVESGCREAPSSPMTADQITFAGGDAPPCSQPGQEQAGLGSGGCLGHSDHSCLAIGQDWDRLQVPGASHRVSWWNPTCGWDSSRPATVSSTFTERDKHFLQTALLTYHATQDAPAFLLHSLTHSSVRHFQVQQLWWM